MMWWIIDANGIEQPDVWETGPTFEKEAMLACPHCNAKTRTHFRSTQFCDGCWAEWTRSGGLSNPPPDVPDGVLFVYDHEMLTEKDVPTWGGKAIQRGNIIEF